MLEVWIKQHLTADKGGFQQWRAILKDGIATGNLYTTINVELHLNKWAHVLPKYFVSK